MNEIIELFQKRDKAVATKDAMLFLSTQVDEFPHAASTGYLSLKRLATNVLATAPGNSSVTKVVFVKEVYDDKTGNSHSAFLLYYLVETPEGWRIYRISA